MANEKVERIKKQMAARLDLYIAKNEMYGDSFSKTFRQYGPISALTRMRDKLDRLETLILNPDISDRGESIIDTLNDLANYCDMTIEAMTEDIPKDTPEEAKPKKSRKRKARKKENKEPKKSEAPIPPVLENLTRDQLAKVAKSLGISVSNKTSKTVIASMIEKEFVTPEELTIYLEAIMGELK